MAYIGRVPLSGDFRKIDNIESQFNSNTNTFSITYQTEAVVPGSPYVVLAVLDGQLLEPGVDYNVNGSDLVFTTAPNAAQSFHAIILGNVGSSYVYSGNVGGGISTINNLSGSNVTLSSSNFNNATINIGSISNVVLTNANISGTLTNTVLSNASVLSGEVSNSTLSNVQLSVYKESIVNLGNVTGSTNVNLGLGNIFRANLIGNTTFTFTNHPLAPLTMPITLIVTQMIGSNTINVTSAVYTENALPQLSTAGGNTDILTFFSPNGGVRFIGTHAIADVII